MKIGLIYLVLLAGPAWGGERADDYWRGYVASVAAWSASDSGMVGPALDEPERVEGLFELGSLVSDARKAVAKIDGAVGRIDGLVERVDGLIERVGDEGLTLRLGIGEPGKMSVEEPSVIIPRLSTADSGTALCPGGMCPNQSTRAEAEVVRRPVPPTLLRRLLSWPRR